MNINSTSQINFNGGFRFINMPAESKAKLPQLIHRGKSIFEDFERQGDVFLVARNTYDQKVLKFIKENNLEFEFYPSISTDLKLYGKSENLKKALDKIKEKPVKKLSEACEALQNRAIKLIQENSPKHITNILKTLCIDNKNPVININGYEKIIDKEFERSILISKPSKHGMRYVKVKPDDKNKEIRRYMMDDSGFIHARFNTPDAMLIFEKRFKELMSK